MYYINPILLTIQLHPPTSAVHPEKMMSVEYVLPYQKSAWPKSAEPSAINDSLKGPDIVAPTPRPAAKKLKTTLASAVLLLRCTSLIMPAHAVEYEPAVNPYSTAKMQSSEMEVETPQSTKIEIAAPTLMPRITIVISIRSTRAPTITQPHMPATFTSTSVRELRRLLTPKDCA